MLSHTCGCKLIEPQLRLRGSWSDTCVITVSFMKLSLAHRVVRCFSDTSSSSIKQQQAGEVGGCRLLPAQERNYNIRHCGWKGQPVPQAKGPIRQEITVRRHGSAQGVTD